MCHEATTNDGCALSGIDGRRARSREYYRTHREQIRKAAAAVSREGRAQIEQQMQQGG